jgi:hypothetical protein
MAKRKCVVIMVFEMVKTLEYDVILINETLIKFCLLILLIK